MYGCRERIPNFEFTPAEIGAAVKNHRLLSMEIEFSLRCNFRCPYCYVPGKSFPENELSPEEIRNAIRQAKALGARKIIVLGGEPTLYPGILEMIRFMRTLDLEVEMFTNGSKITAEFAQALYRENVRVVLKMNTFDETLQDILTGRKGSYEAIRRAFENLHAAGYPSGTATMAVSTIICRQNLDEVTDMWQWLRDRDILPYFEVITPQSNAKENPWLSVDPLKLYEIFLKIAEIDRIRYGQQWDPQPPLVGNRCLRHKFSCLVTSRGDVMPCVGVTIPIGNIRMQPLEEILKGSEVLQDLKNHRHTIKGPCRTCAKADVCYGCRGAAYQLTGDYLASDPMCWKNVDRQSEIVQLPFPVDTLIPHRPPMRVVDTLEQVGERSATVTAVIHEDHPFVRKNGELDESVYLEMMAQAVAALNGFRHLEMTAGAPEGYLLGAKNLEIFGPAQVGDRLTVHVLKYAKYGDFGIIKGRVSRGETVLAKGEIKVWHQADDNTVACQDTLQATG